MYVKLFYTFAFERGTCYIQAEDDWLIKFGCIGYTLGVLFFLIDTHVFAVCPVLSLVMTILSFLFMSWVGIV